MEKTAKIDLTSLTAFPLKEAEACISYYVNTARDKGIPENLIVRSYTVQSNDIIAVLGVGGDDYHSRYKSFRAYLGLENNDLVTNLYKLFLVPIDIHGNDVILQGPTDEYPFDGEYVFDFNTPCPNTCNVDSPLYNAPGDRKQP
jgi:hypothetical protein